MTVRSNIIDRGGLDDPRTRGYKVLMIDETIAKIEDALKTARGSDPRNKAELIALLETLKEEIRREKRSKDALDSAGERLREAAVEFEATHPKLAAVVGEVSSMLASIGI